MYLFGFTINLVTLLALSLVVGILVDDAIVEIENIMRHLEMGKTPYQAAMEAADEIGLAVIATTFTLVAVFLPTAFMSGMPGKFFVQFGWTAAIAVLFSLVVARMLTPMMSAYFLQAAQPRMTTPKWIEHLSANGRSGVCSIADDLIVAAVFFFGSFMLAGTLPTAFQPKDNLSQTQVTLTLPPGSKFEQTYALAEQARNIVHEESERDAGLYRDRRRHDGRQCVRAGRCAGGAQGHLSIQLKPRERTQMRKQQIEDQLREALTGVARRARQGRLGSVVRINTSWC